MQSRSGSEAIRLGVVGVGRGMSFARTAQAVGMELVALCDTWQDRLKAQGEALGVATYTDYDEFLTHDLDAVMLANYYHQHAPLAVRALAAGKHVMSECAACHTLAEGVELVRAVERTGLIYMFAENYPYAAYNQEMRRLFQSGTMGQFRYGEGEYVHPDTARAKMSRSCGMDHWRNWIPATYYCTHSLAPVMFITDTRPVKVNGFVVPYDYDDPTQTLTVRRSDVAGVIICRMDNGAVVKSLHGSLRGHQNYVRIHCNKGVMENLRVGDRSMLRVHRAPFDKAVAEPTEKIYLPDFPVHGEDAARTGHGGGDYFTLYHFAEAIRKGEQPYLDVYRGVEMSIVGILAWKSALSDSAPVAVPDLRVEEQRVACENDNWSPDPDRAGPDQPSSSVLGQIEPGAKAVELARQVWKECGYEGE